MKHLAYLCTRRCTAGLVVPCPLNTYNNETGQQFATSCVRCPIFSETAGDSSTSLDDCTCETGYYDSDNGPGVDCLSCPHGTACTGGATIERLPVLAGRWRTGADSSVIETCPYGLSCLGGTNASAYCLEGHQGPLCMVSQMMRRCTSLPSPSLTLTCPTFSQVCAEGYRQSVGGSCLLCEAGELKVGDATGIGFLLFVVLICTYVCWYRRRSQQRSKSGQQPQVRRGYREPSKYRVQRLLSTVIVKVKIMTAHQQVRQELAYHTSPPQKTALLAVQASPAERPPSCSPPLPTHLVAGAAGACRRLPTHMARRVQGAAHPAHALQL